MVLRNITNCFLYAVLRPLCAPRLLRLGTTAPICTLVSLRESCLANVINLLHAGNDYTHGDISLEVHVIYFPRKSIAVLEHASRGLSVLAELLFCF